jgi:hypothetical protein
MRQESNESPGLQVTLDIPVPLQGNAASFTRRLGLHPRWLVFVDVARSRPPGAGPDLLRHGTQHRHGHFGV